MGMAQRVANIFAANVNELIERFENPELLLKHAIVEMEDSIAATLDQAAKVIANEKILQRQCDEHQAAIALFRRKAKDAVAAGSETEAFRLLIREREQVASIATLAKEVAESAETAAQLRRQIDQMRAKVAEARRKLAILSARKHSAGLGAVGNSMPGSGDGPFERFEKIRVRVERSWLEAEAYNELIVDQISADDSAPAAVEIAARAELELLREAVRSENVTANE